MNIDYVIMSTDSNDLYDNFWEINKKIWKNKMGVKPILVTVEKNKDETVVFSEDCVVVQLPKIENVISSFQSQIARLYATKFFPEQTVLISDLDMIPLSKKFFFDSAELVSDDQILIYTADAYGYQKRYPMCYNLAKGKTYSEILDLECSFKEFVIKLDKLDIDPKWDTDEIYYGKSIDLFEKKYQGRVKKLERGFKDGAATNRIDRDWWSRDRYDLKKIPHEFYYDFHSMRPYVEYKQDIDEIISLIRL